MQEGLKNLSKDYQSKLVGTGTDGSSSMLGNKSGAVKRLGENVNRPYILAVHCNGHKLELAYKDTLKINIPLYQKIELFLTNLYYFYRNSNTTRSGLKIAYAALGKRVVLPKRVVGNRLVGHIKLAIETFLKGYEAFVLHLGQLQNIDAAISRTEKGNKAKHFYQIARSKAIWLMFHFMLDVLHIVAEVSKKFQLRTETITEIMNEIDFAVKSLEKMKVRDGLNLRIAIETEPSGLTGNDTPFISARKKFLTAIIESLHKRFTDNPGVLAAMSIFSLSMFPTNDLEDYGDEDLEQIVDHFRLALEEAAVEVDQISHEWLKLKHHIHKRKTADRTTLPQIKCKQWIKLHWEQVM